VPIVPGETPRDQSDEGVRQAIERLGLPVLVKASAGGGGKGMRRVDADAETLTAIQAARREATAAFGDGALYVERAIPRPRHVEVQVFADNHGNVAHLFDRECSVQRRHQKVIEESPSPVANTRLRSRMTEAAVRATRACGYRNAGTVEFLVDVSPGRGAERFYYLEMNTRLQVEHPVTEQVTGLDLVRAQLLVASNEPLPWTSGSVTQRGHVIEARVYAEDPSRGFLPQAGRILLYREPRMPGVRVDSGIEEGSDVPLHYDPLLAKVIATSATREDVIRRLICAARIPILGVARISSSCCVSRSPRFRAGDVDTGFLTRKARRSPCRALWKCRSGSDRHCRARIRVRQETQPSRPDPAEPPRMARVTRIGPGVPRQPVTRTTVETAGTTSYVAGLVATRGPSEWLGFRPVRRRTSRGGRGAGAIQSLTSPMPATVVKVLVVPGQTVKSGDTLVIVEAMKMELPVRALSDAVVKAVRCRERDIVQADQTLVELE
jgi:acetyl/propionyl-CoA carboxylase alpha subunit